MTVKTVKASGGDYTTLQAAINACPSDITAAGTNETWEIECYSSVTGSNSITISGKTTDATHYIRIYTPQAERHNGISGGFAVETAGYSPGISVQNDHVRIEGIRFALGTNHASSIHITGAAARNVLIAECVLVDTVYGGVRITSVTGGTISLRNCVNRRGNGNFAVLVYASSGSGYTVRAYNCTAYTTESTADGNRLFWNNAGVTCIAKNCLGVSGGGSNVFTGTWSSWSHNNSSDSTAPGTNATTSWSHNFTDAANGDLSLTSEVAGTDLSADADLPFSIDITGATRSGWSRGAFEYAPAGGSNDLGGGATAGASASATLTVQRSLAINAVAGALASGALSVHKPLTGAAIGQAVGSAALSVFGQVWRIPTNAANGTAVHVFVMNGSSPTYGILAQGLAVVAGGFIDVPAAGTPGTKAFAFVHNYNDNTATTSIRGGPSIATLTSI